MIWCTHCTLVHTGSSALHHGNQTWSQRQGQKTPVALRCGAWVSRPQNSLAPLHFRCLQPQPVLSHVPSVLPLVLGCKHVCVVAWECTDITDVSLETLASDRYSIYTSVGSHTSPLEAALKPQQVHSSINPYQCWWPRHQGCFQPALSLQLQGWVRPVQNISGGLPVCQLPSQTS